MRGLHVLSKHSASAYKPWAGKLPATPIFRRTREFPGELRSESLRAPFVPIRSVLMHMNTETTRCVHRIAKGTRAEGFCMKRISRTGVNLPKRKALRADSAAPCTKSVRISMRTLVRKVLPTGEPGAVGYLARINAFGRDTMHYDTRLCTTTTVCCTLDGHCEVGRAKFPWNSAPASGRTSPPENNGVMANSG